MGNLFKKSISTWKKGESGATAVEYGLLAAGIALLVYLGIYMFGDNMRVMFEGFADRLNI